MRNRLLEEGANIVDLIGRHFESVVIAIVMLTELVEQVGVVEIMTGDVRITDVETVDALAGVQKCSQG